MCCCICGGEATVIIVTYGLIAAGQVLYCERDARDLMARAQRQAAAPWN